MTNNHPITPPPELVQQWLGEYFGTTITGEISDVEQVLANRAARWGADMELEACCKVIDAATVVPLDSVEWLRNARRPKPPSLKEQALKSVSAIENMSDQYVQFEQDINIIRHALESLPDN